MKKLNRNNADIKKILNKKVAVVCDSKEKELDFRKWAKQYVNTVDEDYYFPVCHGKDFCIILEEYDIMWDYTQFFENKNYEIYEWEIAEEEKEKIYTIKDVIDNEGKIYRSVTNNCIYKYDKTNLYYKAILRLSDDWRKTELTLREIVELEFIEYKEPKEITFEEVLKEMETKVYRSMFSNRLITIHGSQFFDVSNRENTKLSLSEITGDWIIIEG